LIDINSELAGIVGIHCVLSVDICCNSARLLRFGHDVQGQRRFTGTLRAIDLDNAAARHAAYTHCCVEA
jgi:hypothetical protein